MVDIKNHFYVVAVHLIDNLKCFIAPHEIVAGMVDTFIQRLNDQGDFSLLEEGSNFP